MSTPPLPSFGDLLRRHRLWAELTQEALAERAGLSARGISDLERGARATPRIETVRLLCDALHLHGQERAAFTASARTQAVGGDGDGWVLRRASALPVPPTALIGRAEDVERVQAQLLHPDLRLLTLTGPAGTGKTRLAVAVAAGLVDRFEHGAYFVDLAPISDPDMVVRKVAQAVGVTDEGGEPALDVLRRRLRSRSLLLLLDNFEHVLAAAPAVAMLLEGCPQLSVLVTGRAALRLRWEHEYAVSPLRLPDLALTRGDCEAASRHFEEALAVRRDSGDRSGLATSLEGFAALAAACRRPRHALALAGDADALHRAAGVAPTPVERATLERWLTPIREVLSVGEAAAAWIAGAAMPLEQAVSAAVALLHRSRC